MPCRAAVKLTHYPSIFALDDQSRRLRTMGGSLSVGMQAMTSLLSPKKVARLMVAVAAIAFISVILVLMLRPLIGLFVPIFIDWPDGRGAVVRDVESGAIKPDDAGLAALPLHYTYLSDSGEIIVRDGIVVFFAARGVVGNWRGYVWSRNCALEADPLGGMAYELRDLGGCWFWVAAN
jgi:hypothetical protein